MKSTILAALALASVAASAAQALPVVYERDYTNFAWGYVNRGCIVDANRYVYTYGYGQGADGAITQVGRVEQAEFTAAQALADAARAGTFEQHRGAFDAGTTTWSVKDIYGTELKLKTAGDNEGANNKPEAAQLVALIDTWCGAEQ